MAGRIRMGSGRKSPEIVLRNGKPAAVIVDLDVYEELLERVKDVADLKRLQAMRKKPLRFQRLDDFLKIKTRRVRVLFERQASDAGLAFGRTSAINELPET